MAELQSPLSDQINVLVDQALDQYDTAPAEDRIRILKEAWALMPEPKNQWDESYSIAHGLAITLLDEEALDDAREWAVNLLTCPVTEDSAGEAEMIYAMICFEQGEFAEAMDFFADADEKSEGTCWEAEDPKYEEFFREQLDGLVAEGLEIEEGDVEELDEALYEQIQELSEAGNALLDEDKFDPAIAKFEEALKLLPEPIQEWDASTWLYASMGDGYFLKGDYAKSAEAFYEAMNCPEGNINPFILLRLGQSLQETGDEENATEYLLRAFMVEGEEIFDDEDPKYFAFLQERVELDSDL